MAAKRKFWLEESMEAATKSVIDDGKGLREAARLYNVPVQTLRRRSLELCHWDVVLDLILSLVKRKKVK